MRHALQVVAFALVLGAWDPVAADMSPAPGSSSTPRLRKTAPGAIRIEAASGISIDVIKVPFHAVLLASSATRTVVDSLDPDHAADSSRPRVGDLHEFHLALPGWTELRRSDEAIYWDDDCGDVLNVSVFRNDVCSYIPVNETRRMRNLCRAIAESKRGGLIEARFIGAGHDAPILMVYKRLHGGAFRYTGMLMSCTKKGSPLVWVVISGERGTTGVREAVVTTKLLNERRLTIEQYKSSWAQDPYEPGYRGVDRRTLRYVSDDERYDAEFPEHPLTKVRRVLRALLGTTGLDRPAPCDSAN